jgi:hypothetical protein
MQKVILFILSLLSLFGLLAGFLQGDTIVGWRWAEFFMTWFIFSIPLLVFLLAKAIFRF